MFNYVVFQVLLVTSIASQAQENLLYNGNFESQKLGQEKTFYQTANSNIQEYIDQDFNICEVDVQDYAPSLIVAAPDGWRSRRYHAYWKDTPSLHNTCDIWQNTTALPSQLGVSYVEPFEGDAMMEFYFNGIRTNLMFDSNMAFGRLKEGVNLKNGSRYQVSFKIHPKGLHLQDVMQAAFKIKAYTADELPEPLPYNAWEDNTEHFNQANVVEVVENNNYQFVYSTPSEIALGQPNPIHWKTITSEFVATGKEKYIGLGHFSTGAIENSNYICVENGAPIPNPSTWYVDNCLRGGNQAYFIDQVQLTCITPEFDSQGQKIFDVNGFVSDPQGRYRAYFNRPENYQLTDSQIISSSGQARDQFTIELSGPGGESTLNYEDFQILHGNAVNLKSFLTSMGRAWSLGGSYNLRVLYNSPCQQELKEIERLSFSLICEYQNEIEPDHSRMNFVGTNLRALELEGVNTDPKFEIDSNLLDPSLNLRVENLALIVQVNGETTPISITQLLNQASAQISVKNILLDYAGHNLTYRDRIQLTLVYRAPCANRVHQIAKLNIEVKPVQLGGQVELYPNPVTAGGTPVKIKLDERIDVQKAEIVISTIDGKIPFGAMTVEYDQLNDQVVIDGDLTARLPSATYIVRIKLINKATGKSRIVTKKLIILTS